MVQERRNLKNYEVIEYLRKMPEVNLHTEIVIPLLKGMNFTHIRYLHGANERGKDILYIAKDAFGKSYVGVCQVKNEPFSGRASSKTHTIGILNQLKQCCSIEVHNPETHQNELPQEIVLLSTYPFPNKDIIGASSLLDELKRLRCKLIEPETLVNLIKEKIPEVYARFTYSGEGLIKEISTYVNIHHEAAAFGISRKKKLSDFYVDLGFANPSELQLDMYTYAGCEISKDNKFKIIQWNYDDIMHTMLILPKELAKVKIIELVNPDEINPNNKQQKLAVKKIYIFDFIHNAKTCIEELCHAKRTAYLEKAILFMRATQYFVLFLLSRLIEHPSVGRKSEIIQALQTLRIPEVSPEALLTIMDNVCIVGEAGSGKTSFARMIARKAIQRGFNTIFLPCAILQEQNLNLKKAMANLLKSLSSSSSSQEIKQYLNNTTLFVLDGCDEAECFGESLGYEIVSLAFPKEISEKVSGSEQVLVDIPYDLRSSIVYNNKSKRLIITEPLGQFDFERLLKLNYGPIVDIIKKLRTRYRKRCPKVIVTSRLAKPLQLPANFFTTSLNGFNDLQLSNFFTKWLADTKQSPENVTEFLNENNYIKEVARLPMIATIIAALYENDYDLPQSKSDLYNKRFDLLLDKWQVTKGVVLRGYVKPRDKFVLLMRLALTLHIHHKRRFEKENLEKIWKEGFHRIYPNYSVDELLWELQVCNGVIYNEGGKQYSLGHLSYQEFLVANALIRLQKLHLLANTYFDHWWKNVIIFTAGLCGDVSVLLERLHSKMPLVNDRGILSEIANEARFTSPVVMDFLKDGLDEDAFDDNYLLEDEFLMDDLAD